MLHPARRPNELPHFSPAGRAARLALALVALIQLGPAQPPSAPRSGVRDLELRLQVRRVLRDDLVLGPLCLGVSVRDGVATVWGEVPSRELRERAVKAVKQVRGVVDVRSEMQVARKREELLPLVPRHPDPPTRTQSASPDPVSGSLGTPTGRGPDPEQPPASPVTLLPPRPEGERRPGPVPGRLVGAQTPAPALAEAVERVRQSDARFRPVRAEVRGKVVVLYGGGDEVMLLAQALSRLPGVERVVVAGDGSR